MLIYKSLHGLAPQYLCNVLQVANYTRSGLHSENKVCTLKVPFMKHSTFADRGFSAHGSKAWNKQPLDMRSTTNDNSYDFTKKLKTSLFK